MPKLHEILAAEDTVVSAATKLMAETADKFNKHSEFFMGSTRTLKRVNDSPEDQAKELASRTAKNLATTVPATMDYAFGVVARMLDLKMRKHATNQVAQADVVLDGKTLMSEVPVDFLLDMEKLLPQWRDMFLRMPTLDPSKEWVTQQKGVYKLREPVTSAQTEKIMYPIVMAPATDKHPAQVKEGTKDVTVGVFSDLTFSGAATSQQKADILALCDKLIIAVKEARMRANSVEVQIPLSGPANRITSLFTEILNK